MLDEPHAPPPKWWLPWIEFGMDDDVPRHLAQLAAGRARAGAGDARDPRGRRAGAGRRDRRRGPRARAARLREHGAGPARLAGRHLRAARPRGQRHLPLLGAARGRRRAARAGLVARRRARGRRGARSALRRVRLLVAQAARAGGAARRAAGLVRPRTASRCPTAADARCARRARGGAALAAPAHGARGAAWTIARPSTSRSRCRRPRRLGAGAGHGGAAGRPRVGLQGEPAPGARAAAEEVGAGGVRVGRAGHRPAPPRPAGPARGATCRSTITGEGRVRALPRRRRQLALVPAAVPPLDLGAELAGGEGRRRLPYFLPRGRGAVHRRAHHAAAGPRRAGAAGRPVAGLEGGALRPDRAARRRGRHHRAAPRGPAALRAGARRVRGFRGLLRAGRRGRTRPAASGAPGR